MITNGKIQNINKYHYFEPISKSAMLSTALSGYFNLLYVFSMNFSEYTINLL